MLGSLRQTGTALGQAVAVGSSALRGVPLIEVGKDVRRL